MSTFGRPPKYEPRFCQMLVDHMSQGYSYETFAAVIKTHRNTLYNWEKAYPEFLDAKRTGVDECMKFYESIGVAGMVGKIKGFNPAVWVFSMKNRFKWSDMQQVEMTTQTKDNAEKTQMLDQIKDILGVSEDPNSTEG